MRTFEEDKAEKLKRLPFLRAMHYLGMVAWRKNKYGGATQYLRRMHPLTWIYVPMWALASIIVQGVPETVREVRSTLKEGTVWI